MVGRVNNRCAHRYECTMRDVCKACSRHDLDVMQYVAGSLFDGAAGMVLGRAKWKFTGQILIKRPSEENVDGLKPPADAKHRHLVPHGGAQEREIVVVAQAVDTAKPRRRRGPVPGRLNVLAARKQEEVELRDGRVQGGQGCVAYHDGRGAGGRKATL